jgi:hypothetical protein
MVLEGTRQKVADFIAPKQPRGQEVWDRLHKEAGFIPILNMTDLEARLGDIKEWMLGKDGKEAEFDIFSATDRLKLVRKVFMLFFVAGDAWARGLDNRELAGKISAFLENYTDVGYMEEFAPDLFEEAMQLLSLCWQEMDVTHTPFYVIESKPILSPAKFAPQTELDTTGLDMMNQRVAELTEEVERLKQKQ